MIVIDEIYNCRHGNITTERFSDQWNMLYIPFENSLNAEQINMFYKLLDIQSTISADEMKAAYKTGFKNGVALIRELQA